MQQISANECELSMRFLLCQDAIFHRIPNPLDIEMLRTFPRYVLSQLVLDRQRNDLWIKRQPLEMEIGPGHKLTEHELIQDEYLGNFRSHDNLEQVFQ